MTEKRLRELLQTKVIANSLFYFEKINSTNDFLKGAARELPHGSTAVTMNQFAGNGRRGHEWLSTKDQMAAVSVLLKNQGDRDMPALSLICALSVIKALKSLCGNLDFKIKWPNDILLYGKKLCGILCESKIAGDGCITVCGIGVNISQPPEFFKNAGIPYGASLKMLTGGRFEPECVIAGILNHLEKVYFTLLNGGDADIKNFFDEYSSLCVTLGNEVYTETSSGKIRGTAKSINADGTLNIESEGKTITLSAGDVSIRGIMGYV